MFSAYRLEIIVALSAIALIPVSYALGRIVDTQIINRESHPLTGYVQKDPCPNESGDTSTCWSGYYMAFLEKYPAVDALLDLKMRYETGEKAKGFCHPLLHLIGAEAGREYGSVGEAYKHAETFCRAGYYHGVLEGIFGEVDEDLPASPNSAQASGGEKLLSQLDSFCKDVHGRERYSYDYFSCVHGIGHGLMAYFGHDLF